MELSSVQVAAVQGMSLNVPGFESKFELEWSGFELQWSWFHMQRSCVRVAAVLGSNCSGPRSSWSHSGTNWNGPRFKLHQTRIIRIAFSE